MKFLCVRTDFLGDGVLTSPFIKMLTTTTNASIDFLCDDYNYHAFEYNPNINKIYCLKKTGKNLCVSNEAIQKELNLSIYTAIFLLNRDRETYAFINNIPTKYIFAYELGRKSIRSLTYTFTSKLNTKYKYIHYDNSIHEVINAYNLLKNGLKYLNLVNMQQLNTKCYFYSTNFNPEISIKRDESTIVLNISGKFESNRYIPTSLAICIVAGVIKLNKKVLLVTSEVDKQRAQDIIEYINDSSSISLCCEQNLYTVTDKIGKYKYFIGADGGLLHIAAGLQMHCIGLFHSQNIHAWRPWSDTQVCLQTHTKRLYDINPSDIFNCILSSAV